MPIEELTDALSTGTTRRTIVKTGAKLAYAAPLVAATIKLSAQGALATVSGGCSATYQISGFPFQISGEICDVRDSETGEPAGNAICVCGCPDGIAHCEITLSVGDRSIIFASCCPGNGICVTGGAGNGLTGAVCCNPAPHLATTCWVSRT
jgi:hypothetical protein